MRNKTILLVEDNPDDRDLTVDAFKHAKISNLINAVCDGAEALDYLFGTGAYAVRDLNTMPTLVLLDLNLPKVDGLEVLRRVRADPRTKMLPVIMLTSSQEQEEVVKAYETGCNGYVRKPVDSEQFRKAVNELGLFWLIHNVPPPECG
ncbi:MAG TPA: response regulator [Terriglobia bacterium]|nr:response regulator [Terriglobia bacterium]